MEPVSTEQAAERLGITPIRVRQLIRAGRLPAVRLGKVYVIDRAELERFAEQDRPRGRPRKRDE